MHFTFQFSLAAAGFARKQFSGATFVRNLCFRSVSVSGHFSHKYMRLGAGKWPQPPPLPVSLLLELPGCMCAPPGGVYGIRSASIDEGTRARICNSISVYVWLLPPPCPMPQDPFPFAIETLFTQLVQLEISCLLPKTANGERRKYKNILQSHQCK